MDQRSLAENGNTASDLERAPQASEDSKVVERVEITRELFDSRLRNVTFSSWEDLVATIADKPSAKGYTALHGGSSTVIQVDPVRILGWVATSLLSICLWGLVGYLGTTSALLGLVFTAVFGVGIWWGLTSDVLAPHLAGVIWPNIPCAVSAAGALVGKLLVGDYWDAPLDDGGNSQIYMVLVLLLSGVPHALTAAFFLRDLPRDPDRSPLFMNLFAGSFVTLFVPGCIAFPYSDLIPVYGYLVMLFLGVLSIIASGRLLVIPSKWGSVEIVSWTLNVGSLSVFIAIHYLSGIPWTADLWVWLPFLLLPLVLGLLGAVFGRSLPVILSVCCVLELAGYVSYMVMDLAPAWSTAAAFSTFGLLGAAMIVFAQWLQRSTWVAQLTANLRCVLARAFGSSDPSHFWSEAASPVEDAPPNQGTSGRQLWG